MGFCLYCPGVLRAQEEKSPTEVSEEVSSDVIPTPVPENVEIVPEGDTAASENGEASPPTEGPASEDEEAMREREKALLENTETSSPDESAVAESNPPLPERGEAVPENDEANPDLGTGTFARAPFRVSLSVREGYDDNVYTTNQNTIASFYTSGNVVFDYKFGNARTKVALEAFGGLTYYYNRPFGQEYDISSGFSLSLSHQATPRLGFAANIYMAYQSEPDFNTGFGINRRSGNYFYTSDKFSISYQWAPRFSTVTSYTLGVVNYEESAVAAYEDRFEHTFGNEFRYLLLPTTTVVGEYRYQIIAFDTALRDSTTHFVLGGGDHSFNPRFNISVRGGVQFREFEEFGDRTSPYGEATLNYALGERSSVSWSNRYGLDQPDVPGSASRTTYRTGVRGQYAFSPRFSTTVGGFYQHDENEGIVTPFSVVPAFTEDSIDLALGVRYEFNRTFAGLAGYNHTEVLSDITLREYERNRYYLGLNASF
ncbi:hypothetical protein BH20VER3_BH20VER3_01120 [soil metagenome]